MNQPSWLFIILLATSAVISSSVPIFELKEHPDLPALKYFDFSQNRTEDSFPLFYLQQRNTGHASSYKVLYYVRHSNAPSNFYVSQIYPDSKAPVTFRLHIESAEGLPQRLTKCLIDRPGQRFVPDQWSYEASGTPLLLDVFLPLA